MTTNKHVLNFCLKVALTTAACAVASGATLTVAQSNWFARSVPASHAVKPRAAADGVCIDSQYTTIGAALGAAASGDVIAICPGLYTEQLVITMPVTLRGLTANGIGRVLLAPTLTDLQNLPSEAVITVMNTHDVAIEDLSIDASNNTVTSCSPGVAGVHFYNASGSVTNNAIFGAHLANPLGCTSLPFGNGFGVLVDGNQPGPYQVSVNQNSIHDYTANGVEVNGTGTAITADIVGNTISGVGPANGIFQFAIFVLNGAVATITNNVITEGLCGALSSSDCIGVRSEGITLRAVGDGTLVDSNTITNAQSGIFINGANLITVTNNQIRNIDAMSGMDIQGSASGYFTNSVIQGNSIFNVGPINQDAANDAEGCGINEYSGTNVSNNLISNNMVSDAYCGVAFVEADQINSGVYHNVLYSELDADHFVMFPPAVEP